MNSKAISFSLWGNNPKYTIGAIRNAELANEIYPGWKSIFYVGDDVPDSIIKELEQIDNTLLLLKKNDSGWASMFWRFESSCNPEIQVSLFRDTDSRLSMREKYAVDEWLATDKTFHIMRDHPYHSFPILGGMWGYKSNGKYDMKSLFDGFEKQDKYGTDYEFFISVLYPMIGDDKIVHDPFFDKIDFPQPRIGTEFVGDVFDHNEQRHPDYQKYIG